MGVLSFALAFRSESIKDLVEFASAFGSAGVFVVACFGLFTRIGGPLSAVAGLCTGFLVWLAGIGVGWPAPYVTALGASLVVYLGTATVSRSAAIAPSDSPVGAASHS
jgi:Na+/proline symporter